MNEVKRVIRYLKGTEDLKLKVSDVQNKLAPEVFSDANWGEDRTARKSNSGYVSLRWNCILML